MSTQATLIIPPLVMNPRESIMLWTDQQLLWTFDGRTVFRDQQPVVTIPDAIRLTATLFDREGSLWLGTWASGLHRVKPALFKTYGVREGLREPNVYPTYVDRSGMVWVGLSETSGIDPNRSELGPRDAVRRAPPTGVGTVYEDNANRFWVGGKPGLYLCELPTMACRAEGPPNLRNSAVFAVYGDVVPASG